jgi:hypothetical protein
MRRYEDLVGLEVEVIRAGIFLRLFLGPDEAFFFLFKRRDGPLSGVPGLDGGPEDGGP